MSLVMYRLNHAPSESPPTNELGLFATVARGQLAVVRSSPWPSALAAQPCSARLSTPPLGLRSTRRCFYAKPAPSPKGHHPSSAIMKGNARQST
jgi:hypothetical protein